MKDETLRLILLMMCYSSKGREEENEKNWRMRREEEKHTCPLQKQLQVWNGLDQSVRKAAFSPQIDCVEIDKHIILLRLRCRCCCCRCLSTSPPYSYVLLFFRLFRLNTVDRYPFLLLSFLLFLSAAFSNSIDIYSRNSGIFMATRTYFDRILPRRSLGGFYTGSLSSLNENNAYSSLAGRRLVRISIFFFFSITITFSLVSLLSSLSSLMTNA